MATGSEKQPEPKPILRKPTHPGMQWLFKAPAYLYRAGLGWMMGNRFVMIEHTGRKSGNTYQTVLEVIGLDEQSVDVAAAWGPKSDWLRNIQANPGIRVSMGKIRKAPATARVLDAAAAAKVFADYTEAHPRAAKTLSKSVGLPLDDPEAMAASVPSVRLTLATG